MAASGSNFNLNNYGIASGLGGIGAGIGGLMMGNNSNPSDAAMPYYNQIPGAMSKYQQPYLDAGTNALSALQGQYPLLLNDPGGKLNQIGGSYHQSPGFQFALQQALQSGNHAAAAGGMAGSPQHEQQNMTLATNLANQDYYNWLGQATGLYGLGMNGEQGMAQMGQNSAMNMSDQIAQLLAQQGNLAYTGQQNQNQNQNSAFSNIAGGIGTLAAFL